MPVIATHEVLTPPRLRTFRFGNLFTVAGLAVAVKVAGAAKSAACARFFGIDRALDCYLVAFGLASLICDTMAGSLTPALLPVCSFIESSVSTREYCTGYGWMLYPPALLLAVMGVLLVTIDRFLYSFVAPGFSLSEVELTHKLLFLMAPMLPAFAAIAVFRALLNNQERFKLAALAPVLYTGGNHRVVGGWFAPVRY